MSNFAVRLLGKEVTLAVLTGFGLSLLIVWTAYPSLGGAQMYQEPIFGALAPFDYSKDREWAALNLLVAGTAAIGLALAFMFGRLRAGGASEGFLSAARELIAIAWLPAVFWLGAQFAAAQVPLFLPRISGAFLMLLLLLFGGLARFRREERRDGFADAGLTALVILGLCLFSLVGCFVAAGHLSAGGIGAFTPARGLNIYLAVFGGWFLVIAGVAALSPSVDAVRRRLHGLLLLLQVPLPLLLLVYAASFYRYAGTTVVMYRSLPLYVVIAGFAAYAWLRLFRAFRVWRTAGLPSYRDVLCAPALFPVVAYFLWIYKRVYTFAVDDFHIGEQLLPWQQIVDFGKLPYVDFASIHAAMPLLYGGLNELFYGNTVATFPLAMALVAALAAGLAFLFVFRLAGPVPALLFVPLCYALIMNRLYLLMPALLALSSARVVSSRRAWLAAWVPVCAGSVLYNNAVGAGVILGSAPVAIHLAWREYREGGGRWLAKFGAVLACCGLLVLAVSPVRRSVLGLAQFLLGNASTNSIANGVGMFQVDLRVKSEAVGIAHTQFQSIAVRLSFLVAVLASLVFVLKALLAGEPVRDRRFLYLATLVPVTFLVVGKWLLNRVTSELFVRDGNLSYLALTLVLPLLALGATTFRGRPLLLYGATFTVGAATCLGGVFLDRDALLTRALEPVAVGKDSRLFSGTELGLPRLGYLFAEKQRIDEILALRDAIAPYLKPGETYLDLTNRSAEYFYLDRPVPVLYSANYVAANDAAHARMLRQLRDAPPPIVWLFPGIAWDGGPASLRSYPIYRELVDTYVPRRIGRFTFLIRPDRAGPVASREERLEILDEAFKAENLAAVPNAWGRSWPLVSSRFTERSALTPGRPANFTPGNDGNLPADGGQQVWFDTTASALAGRDVDYLLLDYECEAFKGGPPPVVELWWAADGESVAEQNVVRFAGSGSRALVPVGAQPRWRLARRIDALRVEPAERRSCRTFRVKSLRALELKDLEKL